MCFYLGLFFFSSTRSTALQQSSNPTIQHPIPLLPFWLGIFCGLILVIAIGLDQHFGGLQEARNYLYRQMELYPDKQFPPEFIKRMARNRIYSTLFYPNTLAGALLLFTPPMLLTTIRLGDRWRLGNASRVETILVLIVICLACLFLYLLNTHVGWLLILLLGLSLIFPVPRWVAPTILALGILAVLFWSGSQAGLLLLLLLAVAAFVQYDFSPKSGHKPTGLDPGRQATRNTQHATRLFKSLLIAFLLLAGLTGFFLRYSAFFKTGATSVSARFDYWRAAIQIAKFHPLFGTGPGTFQIPYEKIKRPEAEMARLTHNDYLQQASDSGIPGFLLYTSFIATALLVGARNVLSTSSGSYSASSSFHPRASSLGFPSFAIRHSSFEFAVWLGLLAWAAQCLVEFSLQIPSLAWPAFTLLGYLCGLRRLA